MDILVAPKFDKHLRSIAIEQAVKIWSDNY